MDREKRLREHLRECEETFRRNSELLSRAKKRLSELSDVDVAKNESATLSVDYERAAELQGEILDLKQLISSNRGMLKDLRSRGERPPLLERAFMRLFNIESDEAALERAIASLEERLNEKAAQLDAVFKSIDRQSREKEASLALERVRCEESVTKLKALRDAAEEEMDGVLSDLGGNGETADSLLAGLKGRTEAAEKYREKLDSAIEAKHNAQKESTSLSARLGAANAEKKRLEGEVRDLKQELENLKNDRTAAAKTAEERCARIEELTSELRNSSRDVLKATYTSIALARIQGLDELTPEERMEFDGELRAFTEQNPMATIPELTEFMAQKSAEIKRKKEARRKEREADERYSGCKSLEEAGQEDTYFIAARGKTDLYVKGKLSGGIFRIPSARWPESAQMVRLEKGSLTGMTYEEYARGDSGEH